MTNNEKIVKLSKVIGNTPLSEIKIPEFCSNRVFAKLEFCNPTSSHYDRVYLEIFNELFKKEGILPKKLIEVSSGSAGISFAFFCKYLGFNSEIILPNDVPRRVNKIIKDFNPEIIISTPTSTEYLKSAVELLKFRLASDKNENILCLNHSRRAETLKATEKIAIESIKQLEMLQIEVDKFNKFYFIAACGNGATLIGPGRILKEKLNATIIGFEPKQAPVGYCQKYKQLIIPSNPYHHILFGTGAWGIFFPFIHDEKNYNFSKIVDEISLIDDEDINRLLLFRSKIPWNVGYTSLAALKVIQDIISENKCVNCLFITIFYDRGSKYEYMFD